MRNEPININELLSKPLIVPNASASFTLEDEEITQHVELEPEPEPEPAENSNQPGTSQQYSQEEGTTPPRDMAESGVDTFNFLQENLILMFIKNKMFTQAEHELMINMDLTGNTIYQDGPEAVIMAKHKKLMLIAEKIPFSAREREMLVNAGERYVKAANIQMSPFMALAMCVSGVMGTRVTEVIKQL